MTGPDGQGADLCPRTDNGDASRDDRAADKGAHAHGEHRAKRGRQQASASAGGGIRLDLLSAIEEAIAERGGRREGNEISFRCPRPDHTDTHPSARWSSSKSAWYCDVCKVGGGAIELARLIGIDTRRAHPLRRDVKPIVVAEYNYRDELGELLYQIQRLEPGKNGRAKDFRGRRPDGNGGWINDLKGVRRLLYRLPELAAADKAEVVFIPEGEGKVDRLRALGLVATCAPQGAGKWRDEYDDHLSGRHAVVLADADEPGRRHANQVARHVANVAASVKIIDLPGLGERQDVVDWLDADHTVAELRAIAEAAEPYDGSPRPAAGGDGCGGGGPGADDPREPGGWARHTAPRARIIVDDYPTEWSLSDEILGILSRDRALYVRGHHLARITRSAEDGSAIVDDVRLASLRELIDDRITFLTWSDKLQTYVQVPPPGPCLRAIAARREYLGLRPLSCIVTAPTFRGDGTLISKPGYDAAARMYYRPAGQVTLPRESPTRDDALAALAELEDVIVDFPFTSDADKSVALAIVLTPAVRKMIGNAPMFVADGNVRGVGKGLLINVLLVIATGRVPAPYALPEDDAEMRKRLTALAREGRSVVLFDNVTRKIKFASLDMALTSNGLWGDRILGANESGEWEFRPTWLVTTNNLELGHDATRRSLAVRLLSPHEHPEDRTDIKRKDLLGWVMTERPRLAGAVLTIWRAYFTAGRPQQDIPPWGSFEEWSTLVRQVLVWLDRADPWQTRAELRDRADVERQSILALYTEIGRAFGGEAKAARDLLKTAESDEALREAIIGIAKPPRDQPLPSTQTLATRLRGLRDKPVGGMRLIARPGHGGVLLWTVENVTAVRPQPRPPSPPGGPDGWGGGDGGGPAATASGSPNSAAGSVGGEL